MRAYTKVDGNIAELIWCDNPVWVLKKSSVFVIQVRGYKKDFDDCRKKLYKAEEEYAYEKNR